MTVFKKIIGEEKEVNCATRLVLQYTSSHEPSAPMCIFAKHHWVVFIVITTIN